MSKSLQSTNVRMQRCSIHSKWKFEKLALAARRIWSFHIVVLERAARIYNARAQNIYFFAHKSFAL